MEELARDSSGEFLRLNWAVKAGVAARQDVDHFRLEHAEWLLQPENQEYRQAVSGFLGEFPAMCIPVSVKTHPPPLIVEKSVPNQKPVESVVTPLKEKLKLDHYDIRANKIEAEKASNRLKRNLDRLAPPRKLKWINPVLAQWMNEEKVGSPAWQGLENLRNALNMAGKDSAGVCHIWRNMEEKFRKMYIDKTQYTGEWKDAWNHG